MSERRPASSLHRFANPSRFLRLSRRLTPWLAVLTVGCLGAGLYIGLFVAPPDYQQGESVRIMYVHVPAAWMALFVYACMPPPSVASLVWRHPLADLIAQAAAPVGAGFTAVALVTGSLWGQPMWGTWWVWDARLTSVLILFFLYLGHIALMNAFDDPTRGERAAAILALVGVVNMPIIKFSVDWWNTLHQGGRVPPRRADHRHLDAGAAAPDGRRLSFYYLLFLLLRVRTEIVARKIRTVQLLQAAP